MFRRMAAAIEAHPGAVLGATMLHRTERGADVVRGQSAGGTAGR
jgi:hypothetical protein